MTSAIRQYQAELRSASAAACDIVQRHVDEAFAERSRQSLLDRRELQLKTERESAKEVQHPKVEGQPSAAARASCEEPEKCPICYCPLENTGFIVLPCGHCMHDECRQVSEEGTQARHGPRCPMCNAAAPKYFDEQGGRIPDEQVHAAFEREQALRSADSPANSGIENIRDVFTQIRMVINDLPLSQRMHSRSNLQVTDPLFEYSYHPPHATSSDDHGVQSLLQSMIYHDNEDAEGVIGFDDHSVAMLFGQMPLSVSSTSTSVAQSLTSPSAVRSTQHACTATPDGGHAQRQRQRQDQQRQQEGQQQQEEQRRQEVNMPVAVEPDASTRGTLSLLSRLLGFGSGVEEESLQTWIFPYESEEWARTAEASGAASDTVTHAAHMQIHSPSRRGQGEERAEPEEAEEREARDERDESEELEERGDGVAQGSKEKAKDADDMGWTGENEEQVEQYEHQARGGGGGGEEEAEATSTVDSSGAAQGAHALTSAPTIATCTMSELVALLIQQADAAVPHHFFAIVPSRRLGGTDVETFRNETRAILHNVLRRSGMAANVHIRLVTDGPPGRERGGADGLPGDVFARGAGTYRIRGRDIVHVAPVVAIRANQWTPRTLGVRMFRPDACVGPCVPDVPGMTRALPPPENVHGQLYRYVTRSRLKQERK